MAHEKPTSDELASQRGRAIDHGWVQLGSHRGIGYTIHVDEDDAIRCLRDDAEDVLPPDTRYEIRKKIASNYGRSKGIAWYHISTFSEVEPWVSPSEPTIQPEGGYVLVSRNTTRSRDSKTLSEEVYK